MIISNIVEKSKLREVQLQTLDILSRSLQNSFGPNASSTKMVKLAGQTAVSKYSKDGHTILGNIIFQDFLEESVKKDLEDLTRHITVTVGDGTTSAIVLSSILFKKMTELEEDFMPYDIITHFKEAVKEITEEIKTHKVVFNADMAYKITLISTNGNEEVAQNIKNIYEKFGNDVFIDVSASINENSYLKEYDGMTLDAGYDDVVFMNNPSKGTCSIRNPRIYVFEDPVDTEEMFSLFVKIIDKNIINVKDSSEMIPTVIITPKVSRDLNSFMDSFIASLYKLPAQQRPPILLLTNVVNKERLADLSKLCGCKTIKKYIDTKIQEMDVKNGDAPTLDTVHEFYGLAEMVEANVAKTKIINPKDMYDKNGDYSDTFKSMISFLEAELQHAYDNGENNNVTGSLKRRINSLKANMVDYIIGSAIQNDRDNLRDLIEDAVLNCRSAAKNGVGYGANFEGLLASIKLSDRGTIYNIIAEAYKELVLTLYKTCYKEDKAKELLEDSISNREPFNLRTKKFDGNILSSIDSDVVILDTISQIVTLMFTSNQFLCPTPAHNKYKIFE